MTETLQPILALLDEGLSLYRRNFVGFVLITASWFVPVAVAAPPADQVADASRFLPTG